MRLRLLAGVALMAVVVGASAASPVQELRRAPNFKLTDTYGDKVRLSDYRGKIVALHFWAKWCGSCKLDLEYFQQAHERYGSEDVVVLGLAYASGARESVQAFADEIGATFTILMANDDVLEDYDVATFPTNVIVDRDGKIRHVSQRLMDHGFWERIFREMLAETDE